MPGYLSGGLTVLIVVSRACLRVPLAKCFTCAFLPILFALMSPKLYKIIVSKGDICKHEKSVLNVSGMFFYRPRGFLINEW